MLFIARSDLYNSIQNILKCERYGGKVHSMINAQKVLMSTVFTYFKFIFRC